MKSWQVLLFYDAAYRSCIPKQPVGQILIMIINPQKLPNIAKCLVVKLSSVGFLSQKHLEECCVSCYYILRCGKKLQAAVREGLQFGKRTELKAPFNRRKIANNWPPQAKRVDTHLHTYILISNRTPAILFLHPSCQV